MDTLYSLLIIDPKPQSAQDRMTWFPQESTKMKEKNLSWFYLLSYTFPVTAPFQECFTRGISTDSGSIPMNFKRLHAQRMWM